MLFFHYVLRKLARRIANNAVTVGAIALVLAGCMVGIAFLNGLARTVKASAPAEHVIVTSMGAISEQESSLSQDVVKQLSVMTGVKREGTEAHVSPELVGTVVLSTDETIGKEEEQLIVRGVEPIAMAIHGATVIFGRAPEQSARELMIGEALSKKHPELVVGRTLELPGGTWQIVGVFAANGSMFENEAWGSLSGLMRDLRQSAVSTAIVVAESAERAPELIREINDSKRLSVLARSERSFREDAAGVERVRNVVLILVVMLSLVGLFATATNLDASIVTRLPEFATMIALGVRRGRVAMLAIQESLVLAMSAAIFAIGLTSLLHGRSTAMLRATAVFDLKIGIEVVAVGLILGVIVGIAGGLFSALTLKRLDLLEGLR